MLEDEEGCLREYEEVLEEVEDYSGGGRRE